jgi:F420-0:gamma-glutamyl ligase-like protein
MIKIHVHFASINIKLYVKYLFPKVIKRVWAMKKNIYENKRSMPKSMSQKKERKTMGTKMPA